MKTLSLGLAVVFLAGAQEVLTNDAVVKMVKSGLGENLVISMIQGQPGEYSLNSDELLKLKETGVSEKILAAMASEGPGSGTSRWSASLTNAGRIIVGASGTLHIANGNQRLDALATASTSTPDPSPADNDTALVADESDSLPIGSRTPLILIHGVLGNQQPDGSDSISKLNSAYFGALLTHWGGTDEAKQFKIYRFHYVSDKYPVSEIARAFRNKLDAQIQADGNFDKPFVIVAHSMGGLVARSYMNQQLHYVGLYAGRNGGEHVSKLITLATPHHGSPVAGDSSRIQITSGPDWNAFLDLAILAFWANIRVDVNGTPIPIWTVPYNQPNRKDLLWDNFDQQFDPSKFGSEICSGSA
jgi:pimeloyl-ACP methyl ester carboxylesterase